MGDDPQIDPRDESEPSPGPPSSTPPVPCRHLRNKGMLVYNEGAFDTRHEDYDNTVFWCVETLKGFGPDDEMVGREDCANSDRACYEPF